MASNVSVVNATAKSIGDVGTARDGDGGRDGTAECGPWPGKWMPGGGSRLWLTLGLN